jgi:glucosamine--fructose-6-phosphate aminotransferase (isomerizing)
MGKVRPRMLIVSDGDRKDFAVDCHYVKVPKTVFPITMPLTQFVPLSLLAGYIQNLLGEEDARGCRGPWAFCADGSSVRDSQIIRDIGRQEALNGID